MKTTSKLKISSLSFAAAITLSASLNAATTVAGYSINDTSTIVADTLAPGVTSTDLTSPDWTLAVAGNDFFNIPESGGMEDGTGDDMVAAFTSGQFVEFTMSSASATPIALDQLLISVQRSSRGPQDIGVRVSTDGFAGGNSDTGLAAYDLFFNQAIGTATSLQTVSLSGLTLDSTTDITIRIAFDDRANNNSANSAGRFYDIEVSAVPEPSSTALLGLGGLALIVRRRK